jgi:hypothetical protein
MTTLTVTKRGGSRHRPRVKITADTNVLALRLQRG